jgi:ATP-binding cassette subfamily F protein uup
VLVSHDRDLMDHVCTEYVGLDGRGGAGGYGSVDQWLSAYAGTHDPPVKAAEKKSAPPLRATAKPKKLSFKEQQEWDGMEAAVLTAEAAVAACEAEVGRAAAAGHVALAAACRALDDARAAIERLYARWQELEARRGP